MKRNRRRTACPIYGFAKKRTFLFPFISFFFFAGKRARASLTARAGGGRYRVYFRCPLCFIEGGISGTTSYSFSEGQERRSYFFASQLFSISLGRAIKAITTDAMRNGEGGFFCSGEGSKGRGGLRFYEPIRSRLCEHSTT